MDGHQPPPGFSNYGHNDWNVCHEGSDDMEHHSDISLTSSQTQTLASIMNVIGEDQSVFGNSLLDHQSYDISSGFGEPYQIEQNTFLEAHSQQFHQQQCADQVPPAQPTAPPSSVNGIPPLDSWPGELNYYVEFSKAQDKTKATPWVYSTKLEKLFVSMDKACPIYFKLNISPLEFSQYQIRGQVVYSRAEDFHDSVERCINHQQKDPSVYPFAAHVLRCDDASATYFDHENKRRSVVVSLKPPAPGTQSVTLCFRFMCLSSCIGSLNRRPTKLIFTLERLNGVEVGRYAVPVRICSCPGRDVRSEEEKMSSEESVKEGALIPLAFPGKTKKRKAPVSSAPLPQPPSSRSDSDENVFNLNVDIVGREQYEAIRDVVNRMMEAFERIKPTAQQNDPKRFKEEP